METIMNVYNMSDEDRKHVHEFEASTHLAEEEEERHNHRFAGVTGEAKSTGGGRHVHDYCTNTDFFEDHHHVAKWTTGPNIELKDGKNKIGIIDIVEVD